MRSAKSPLQLHKEIRTYLLRASDQRLIQEPRHEIYELIKRSDGRKPGAPADQTHTIAIGDERNFNRRLSLPHLTRPDGWWFDFQISLLSKNTELEIISYGFEIREPIDANRPLRWIRWDYSPPRVEKGGEVLPHDNVAAGLRAHMHVFTDDDGFSVPAPIMTPFELFDVLLHRLQLTGRERAVDREHQLVREA